MEENKKPIAGRAPWKREDALVWALKVAESQVPVSDVLADASMISAYLDGEIAPADQAIVTVQRYRDQLPTKRGQWERAPWATGALDEFLGDLIRDLRETIIDAEVVDDSDEDPVSERDRARSTATRLEQELAEKERELDESRHHLAKEVLAEVMRIARGHPERSTALVAELVADTFGVEL